MTSDYKEMLLNWLIGNYQTGVPINVIDYSQTKTITNNLVDYLTNEYPDGYLINDILQGQDSNNNGVGYSVIWGQGYDSTNDIFRTFFLILDNDFNIIQIIKNYSSGTKFGEFYFLTVAEDGNFYGIEEINNVKRFVMMNNFVTKLPNENDYKVILRQSYNLQGESTRILRYKNILKAPGVGKYLLVGNDSSDHVIATELTINVGASNDWIDYVYNDRVFMIGDTFSSWDSAGNITFRIAGFLATNTRQNVNFAELTNDNTNNTLILTDFGTTIGYVKEYSIKKISLNESYFGIFQTDPNELPTYKLFRAFFNDPNFNTPTYYLLQETYSDTTDNAGIKFYKTNNEVFVRYLYQANNKYIIKIGRLTSVPISFEDLIELDSFDVSDIDSSLFIVTKQFNLYNFFSQYGNNVYNAYQIYNENNYNGYPYMALNSMIPNTGILLDSNNVVIFARNLYNRIINDNTTTAILNIPNNFINDIEINTSQLFGETNEMLIEDNSKYSTNIYEELLINFINTINISNQNNINNIIENRNGAERLNESVSSKMDYNNCYIGKYKINYSDNTSEIFNIDTNLTFVSNLKRTYTILVYVPENKIIENIQLLSNDENTIYQTLKCDNMQSGKLYKINQDISVI